VAQYQNNVAGTGRASSDYLAMMDAYDKIDDQYDQEIFGTLDTNWDSVQNDRFSGIQSQQNALANTAISTAWSQYQSDLANWYNAVSTAAAMGADASVYGGAPTFNTGIPAAYILDSVEVYDNDFFRPDNATETAINAGLIDQVGARPSTGAANKAYNDMVKSSYERRSG